MAKAQKTAQKKLFLRSKLRHVSAAFSSAQNRAKRDHENLKQTVAGIARARIT
jgi:hypothetical protein